MVDQQARPGSQIYSGEIVTAQQARERIEWLWVHTGAVDVDEFVNRYDPEMTLALDKYESLTRAESAATVARLRGALEEIAALPNLDPDPPAYAKAARATLGGWQDAARIALRALGESSPAPRPQEEAK